ncbi:MAG: type ISP restriction/modification enzyme [Pyrinomonadaceae bacterium]
MKKQAEDDRDKRKCKIYYTSLDDFWRKEEKLAWLRDNPISKIEFERIEADAKHNWINQSDNDFETLLPLVNKDVKRGKAEEAIFELFSLGVVTAKDEWSFDFDKNNLLEKSKFLCDYYGKSRKKGEIDEENSVIKWTSELKDYLLSNTELKFNKENVRAASFRPFTKKYLYFDKIYTHRTYQNEDIFGIKQNHENYTETIEVGVLL